jgi:deoxyribose-phosphate aldolase
VPKRSGFRKNFYGLFQSGRLVADITLIRKNLPTTIQIKASGGIRDLAFAKELIAAVLTALVLPRVFNW